MVRLYWNGTTAPPGVYHCEIPDSNGVNQYIYVGIYQHGQGILIALSLTYCMFVSTIIVGFNSISSH